MTRKPLVREVLAAGRDPHRRRPAHRRAARLHGPPGPPARRRVRLMRRRDIERSRSSTRTASYRLLSRSVLQPRRRGRAARARRRPPEHLPAAMARPLRDSARRRLCLALRTGERGAARFCLGCGERSRCRRRPARSGRSSPCSSSTSWVHRRSDRADPEDVRATLRPYHEHVKADIERFGGRSRSSSAMR